jgi:hypothetical protein
MNKFMFSILLNLPLGFEVMAQEITPCKPYEKSVRDLQKFCQNEVKKYAKEKHGLGLMGLARLRNSKDTKDQTTRQDLGRFGAECKKNEALKLHSQKQLDDQCLARVVSSKNQFE